MIWISYQNITPVKTLKKIFACIALAMAMALILAIAQPEVASGADGRSAYYAKGSETVATIAKNHHVDAELLAAMNNLSPGFKLQKGQCIWLPLEPTSTVVIKKGDTLWDLAHEYNTSVSILIAQNNLANPNRLKVGQKLTVPVEQDEYCISPIVMASASPSRSTVTTASRSGSGYIWPIKGIITSSFGKRNGGYHHGLDIAADKGTAIAAAKAGTVTFTGWYSSIYGRAIIIRHSDTEESVYAHLQSILVSQGAKVKAGQTIATVGESGNATGPHLHLEIRINNSAVNPIKYLR